MIRALKERIFDAGRSEEFEVLALEVFRHQAVNNPVYAEFTRNLGIDIHSVRSVCEIPFLPAEIFRTREVVTGSGKAEAVFESSSTTGSVPSRHYVTDLSIYTKSFLGSFGLFYGDPSVYLIAALLPSYTEREGSSLVYMVSRLIEKSRVEGSAFYRGRDGEMVKIICKARDEGKKVILLGVSFALLDLGGDSVTDLSGITVMETGGMKGRRREMTRAELHRVLSEKFRVPLVHSEYGMTELLSQGWSKGEGIFNTPPWMKILLRDTYDPRSVTGSGPATGGINIIDLANVNSCSFIATGDIGRLHGDGSFEVLGRFDSSDVRGCNLLAV